VPAHDQVLIDQLIGRKVLRRGFDLAEK